MNPLSIALEKILLPNRDKLALSHKNKAVVKITIFLSLIIFLKYEFPKASLHLNYSTFCSI